MKTQRRHELQTNELADNIGKYIQAIRPYQNYILYGTVAVIAVVVAALWMNRQNQVNAGLSWGNYFSALDQQRPESLEDVAKAHNGSTAALWSLQSAGEMQLAEGSRQMYQDRDAAEKALKDAEKNLEAVESGAQKKSPELARRARFSLGRVYEAMCEVEKARDAYKQVAEDAPETVLGKAAEQRFKRLSSDSVEGWYAWFDRQEPILPGAPGSTSGPDMGPLGDLDNLPDRPDLSFPTDSLLNEPLSTDVPAEPSSREAGDWPAATEGDATPESTDPVDETMDAPEATEPEATEPEATEPEATEPEATEPEATEPEATEPEASEPEPTPEAPVEEQPDTEGDQESSDSPPETPDPPASDESEPSEPADTDESS